MEPGNPYSYWYLKPVSNLMFLMLIFLLFHKENSTKALFLEYYLRLFRKKTQQEIWLFSPNNGLFIEWRLAFFFVKQIFL